MVAITADLKMIQKACFEPYARTRSLLLIRAARPFSGLMNGFLKAAAATATFPRLLQEVEQGSAALMSLLKSAEA